MTRELEIRAAEMRIRHSEENLAELKAKAHRRHGAAALQAFWTRLQDDIEMVERENERQRLRTVEARKRRQDLVRSGQLHFELRSFADRSEARPSA